jgi:hypothetical protein
MKLVQILGALAALALAPAAALGQNVGGVFGPTVNAGHKSLEWRLGVAPNANDDWQAVSRLHYQQSLNDTFRLRGVVQFADPAAGDAEFKFAQVELLWQTVERTDNGYEQGLTFAARATENDDGADKVSLTWINQWTRESGTRFRALLLLNTDVGSGARDGVNVGFRSSVTWPVAQGVRIGIEHFSGMGNTDAGFKSFDEQRHSVGPVITGRFNGDWGWYAGVQLGVSERANDHDWQFRINRRF